MLGAYSMRNFGESPSVAVESSLSQILEDNPHPKYYLSAKACRGILRRAERRGKELPPMLKEALERQSDSHTRQVTGGNQIPLVMYQHKYGDYREGVGTLKENCGQPSNSSGNIACGAKTYQKVSGCLSPGAHPGSYNGQDAHNDMLISNQYAVRRLTPLECDRLMGYPDNWTLIPGASDTARYKADGNSVAIPCVEYVLEGIAEILRQ